MAKVERSADLELLGAAANALSGAEWEDLSGRLLDLMDRLEGEAFIPPPTILTEDYTGDPTDGSVKERDIRDGVEWLYRHQFMVMERAENLSHVLDDGDQTLSVILARVAGVARDAKATLEALFRVLVEK